MSDKVAGRLPKNRGIPGRQLARTYAFNAKVAHQKWTSLEKQITTVALKKQTLYNMEQDMDRWVKVLNYLCCSVLRNFLRNLLFNIMYIR